jgi:hypothetical protein
VPVAANCLLIPLITLGVVAVAGETTNELNVALVIVNVVLPDVAPEVALISDVPEATPLARPLVFTVATLVFAEDHSAEVVMSVDVPSEKNPVAFNCCVLFLGILRLAGVTAIEDNVASVTVNTEVADIAPEVAVITDDPVAIPLAIPLETTVATLVSADDQVIEALISTDVPSEYVPVAVNCSVKPLAMLGSTGVSAIELNTASVTVNVEVADLAPKVAVTTEVPVAKALARPLSFTVATSVFADDQVADAVMSTEIPSE